MENLGFNKAVTKNPELFPSYEIDIHLTENQELIFKTIFNNPQISLDDLAAKIGLSSHKILPVILELELLGKVKSFSGRQFMAI